MCASPPNPTNTQWKSAATLDVVRGNNWGAPKPASPVVFPGNGATTSLTRFVAESPDPRSFCGWGGTERRSPVDRADAVERHDCDGDAGRTSRPGPDLCAAQGQHVRHCEFDPWRRQRRRGRSCLAADDRARTRWRSRRTAAPRTGASTSTRRRRSRQLPSLRRLRWRRRCPDGEHAVPAGDSVPIRRLAPQHRRRSPPRQPAGPRHDRRSIRHSSRRHSDQRQLHRRRRTGGRLPHSVELCRGQPAVLHPQLRGQRRRPQPGDHPVGPRRPLPVLERADRHRDRHQRLRVAELHAGVHPGRPASASSTRDHRDSRSAPARCSGLRSRAEPALLRATLSPSP